MTTTATTASTTRSLRSILAAVREYGELLTVYDAFVCRGRLPPPTLRCRFKLIERALQEPPLALALSQYICHLRYHPRHPSRHTTTTLDRKGRCRVCLTAVHCEWLDSVARLEIAYLCARCGCLFVPTLG